MIKEDLEKEAREYLAEHSKYSEIFGEFFVAVDTLTAILDFAEPREKQIQIDAEQIRALQKQNGELTDELTLTNNECKEMREELKQRIRENQKLCEQIEGTKCECRRCVYTDCPCVLSDYEKDRNGICDHFKDVFDENAELREELKQAEKGKVVEHFEAYGQCRDSRRIAELEEELQQAMKQIHNLLYVYQLGKNELATARIRAEAEQFLKDNNYFN